MRKLLLLFPLLLCGCTTLQQHAIDGIEHLPDPNTIKEVGETVVAVGVAAGVPGAAAAGAVIFAIAILVKELRDGLKDKE